MEAIVLRADLREAVEKDAVQEARSINEIVNEAVEQYVRERQRIKLDREIAAYEAMHAELRQKYFGQWVAVYEQKLIDHDEDRAALYRRVRAKLASLPVLIRQVTAQTGEDIWMRTPSTGKIGQ